MVDGKFRVHRKLGEGGTSTIYEVRHAITDKSFAIKWLSPELAQNELAVERFVHEAKVCGRYVHPNAVQIYDVCHSAGSVYLLMELLEGESLDSRLERVPRFSVPAACDILLPCAEALHAAHRLGIVHRDLKPSNIFLCRVEGMAEEVPKVLDFGISKHSQNGHNLSLVTTTTRTVIGTPQYMSPEQMRGLPPEPRFDVYALGVVLYEMLSGRLPFECDTFADLVFKVIEGQPTPLTELADVEPAFAAIVARAMAADSGQRYASMAELADALRPYSSHGSVLAKHAIRAAPSVHTSPRMAAPAPPAPEPEPEPVALAEDLPRASRTNGKRALGLSLALGAALLLAWGTGAFSRPAPVSIDRAAPIRAAPALAQRALPPQKPEPPTHIAEPSTDALATPAAAASPVKPARRVHKRVSAPAIPPSPSPAIAEVPLERADATPPKRGVTIPPTGLSRQDF